MGLKIGGAKLQFCQNRRIKTTFKSLRFSTNQDCLWFDDIHFCAWFRNIDMFMEPLLFLEPFMRLVCNHFFNMNSVIKLMNICLCVLSIFFPPFFMSPLMQKMKASVQEILKISSLTGSEYGNKAKRIVLAVLSLAALLFFFMKLAL